MKYNPQIHHRRSIRLKGYDYSQAGLFFITICTQNRECLFGEIRMDEPMCLPQMILNDAGKMIAKWYNELENKFPDIRCHEMIIMPNHFHCIVENTGKSVVGADQRVCPINTGEREIMGEHVGSPLRVCPDMNGQTVENGRTRRSAPTMAETPISGEHVGSPLHRVIQWFKTMTTNEYIRGVKTLGWASFDGKLWQRNYWEHIIRNENEYNRIAEYINDNPQNWDNDTLK